MNDSFLEFDPEPLKARKGRSLPAGGRRRLIVGNQATIARTVKRVPEVMVKISSSAKNLGAVGRNVDYISRQGKVAVEDEQGHRYVGEHTKADALYTWGHSIPATGERRRETFNVIFSMPAGTPRTEVTEAVRRFAAHEFANHQYLFATHHDEDHPHVHLIIKAAALSGRQRLNPRKADLQRWRARFAEQLRGLGIEANATPRAARGVVRKPDKQAVLHINERARAGRGPLARVTQGQVQAARDELQGEARAESINAVIALLDQRKEILAEYGAVAQQLVKGPSVDRQLAVEVVNFAKTLPPVHTVHDQRVAALKQQQPTLERGPEL